MMAGNKADGTKHIKLKVLYSVDTDENLKEYWRIKESNGILHF